MKRFLFGAYVEHDLREIRDYIAQDDPAAAHRLMVRLVGAFRRLAARPKLGRTRSELARPSLRVWPVGSYLILYRHEKQPIEIVAVLHGARDIPAIMNRRL